VATTAPLTAPSPPSPAPAEPVATPGVEAPVGGEGVALAPSTRALRPAPGAEPARSAPAARLLAEGSSLPDSLFDHSADVEFVLDPVKLHREPGRGYTPVSNTVRGETASITF
jgi:hypothetical protein